MKKYFKITLLVAILFIGLFATKKVNAEETTKFANAKVTYGEITDSGVPVTLTFSRDLPSNANLGDGWIISGKTAKKTLPQGSIFSYYCSYSDDTVEMAKFAVPIKVKVGTVLDLSSMSFYSGLNSDTDTYKISDLFESFTVTDNSIATVSGSKITAIKSGNTTLKGFEKQVSIANNLTLADENNTNETWTWNLTVVDDSSNSDMELTDFTNAKYSWDSTTNDPKLIISNVTPISKHSYKYAITNNDSNTPSISDAIGTLNSYDNKFNPTTGLGEYIALNQDLYLWVWESDSKNEELVVKGVKIEKPEIPEYTNAISDTTTLSHNWTNISLTYPFGRLVDQDRKINIKIGKISDNTILQKIHNENKSGFSDLLNYSKTAETIYSNTLTANEYNGYETNLGDGALTGFDYRKLEDGAYYFLYIELDDEGGKYIPAETVTFAQASTYFDFSGDWFLFFYGSADFKWANIDLDEQRDDDTTVAPTVIPATGEKAVIGIIALLLIITVATHFKLKNKYNGIK